jgi:hypothetical protein
LENNNEYFSCSKKKVCYQLQHLYGYDAVFYEKQFYWEIFFSFVVQNESVAKERLLPANLKRLRLTQLGIEEKTE